MTAITWAGCLLGLFTQGAPWYWPNGEPFSPGRILQGHGQYETFRDVNGLHRGLDVVAVVGEDVRSPVDGVVTDLYITADPFPYSHVVIQPEGGAAVKVIHLDPVEVNLWQSVRKGETLGKVGSWPPPGLATGDIPTPHVHLELAEDNNEDPLPYLGGRLDRYPPFFREIVDGSGGVHWPVAFVKDTLPNAKLPIDLYLPPLAPGPYDVLVRVGDYFCQQPFYLPPMTFIIGGLKVSIKGFWIWLPGRRIAPTRLSLRIQDSSNGMVFENTIDVTTTDWNSYRQPHDVTLLDYVSHGAPNPDFYFVLTHPDNSSGTPESSWVIPAVKKTYEIEVTVEDASGNINSETFTVDSL